MESGVRRDVAEELVLVAGAGHARVHDRVVHRDVAREAGRQEDPGMEPRQQRQSGRRIRCGRGRRKDQRNAEQERGDGQEPPARCPGKSETVQIHG